MSKIKTAYELASERYISPSFPKENKEENTEIIFSENFLKNVNNLDDFINLNKDLNDFKIKINPIIEKKPERITYPNKNTYVYWCGHFMGYTGFSRLNRVMLFGLNKIGIYIKPIIEKYLDHINKETIDFIIKLSKIEIPNDSLKIYGSTTPLELNHSGKQVLYTMIESESLHPNYVGKLNMVDEIWVPTLHNKNLMKEQGVITPIKIIPLGVDLERYKPNLCPIKFSFSMNTFKFLSVFRWSYRKGYDILLKAYLEEFNDDDDVSLLIVSRIMDKPEDCGSSEIIKDFNSIRNEIKKSKFPHVVLYDKPISEKYMPNLYNTCDAFVLPTRGEGFGLPLIESSICGLPIISTKCSGHSDFLNNKNSFLINPDGYIKASRNGKMYKMAKMCHFYQGQKFPDFSITGVKQLRNHMRYVFENYKEAKNKNNILMENIKNNYNWDSAIAKVYDRINVLTK